MDLLQPHSQTGKERHVGRQIFWPLALWARRWFPLWLPASHLSVEDANLKIIEGGLPAASLEPEG